MYIFLGVIGLVMLLLMAAFIAILYFQCCKKKGLDALPNPEGQFNGTNPIRSGTALAPVHIGATAPVLVVDRSGSFNGTNPLRPQAASTT
jgi:hypothetical protein